MKQKLLYSLALAAMLLFGAGAAKAQNDKGYEAKPLTGENAAMAQQVMEQQLEQPDKAYAVFLKMFKKIKNDKDELINVGDFFLNKRVLPLAKKCADQLYTIAPTYIPGLMFEGRVALLRHDYGNAGMRFDEVLRIDSTNISALKQNAHVYKNVNPAVAVEALERIQKIEPGNYSVQKELGDINYNLDKYKAAVKNYKAFFAAVPQDTDHIYQATVENYVNSLYSTADFFKLADVSRQYQTMFPKSIALKRMTFFADVNNEDTEKAKESIKYLTEKMFPDSFYIYLDYEYAGTFTADQLNDIPTAISYYEQALSLDPTKATGYKDVANLYSRNKQAEKAIERFSKYLSLAGDKVDSRDNLRLGEIYARASQDETIAADKRNEYFDKAVSLFEQFNSAETEQYQSSLMLARMFAGKGDIKSAEAGKARTYFEEVLKRCGTSDDVKSVRIQALSYLVSYFIQNDMNAEARKVTTELLSVDPTNDLGKKASSFLNSVK